MLGSDRDDRGVGFAFGLERLKQVLDAQGRAPGAATAAGFVVVAGVARRTPPTPSAWPPSCGPKGPRCCWRPTARPTQAVALARDLGSPRVVAVAGRRRPAASTLHDLAAGTTTEVERGALARLARDEAEGRRR